MFYTDHSSAGKPGTADRQGISGQTGVCAGLRRGEICGTQGHAELFSLCAGAVWPGAREFPCAAHTFATCCVEVSFDVKSLSEILGHANVNITMNRYVHPSMELKHQNMQKLSGLFAVN